MHFLKAQFEADGVKFTQVSEEMTVFSAGNSRQTLAYALIKIEQIWLSCQPFLKERNFSGCYW